MRSWSVNTIMADDPELTTRLEGDDMRQPLRVVLDSQLRTRMSAGAVGPTPSSPPLARVAWARPRSQPPAAPDGRGGLEPLLDELGKRGILSLLVEGGSECTPFFARGLVDKVHARRGASTNRGREALGPVGGPGVERPPRPYPLRELDATRLGTDLLITGIRGCSQG
jgi:diaminohydroxyphosphoribosylaminopyrimidine deaminase/5-amino-6-(5-phosphoribosylamino)uracil reductase